LRFARAVLASGHSLHSVFFYADGVYCALSPAASDSIDSWQKLSADTSVNLSVCVGASERRGLPIKQDIPSSTNGFTVSGLGSLAHAAIEADRLLTFGS